MANLGELEKTQTFLDAPPDMQKKFRIDYFGREIATTKEFQALTPKGKAKIRSRVLDRPLPSPPATMAETAQVALAGIGFGTASPELVDKVSPEAARLISKAGRVSLGFERGTIGAVGGLVPPVRDLLRERFLKREDLLKGLERGEDPAALLQTGAELAASIIPFSAGMRAVTSVTKFIQNVTARRTATFAGAGGVGGLELAGIVGTTPENTVGVDIPGLAAVVERANAVVGLDPETQTVGEQQVRAFFLGVPLGIAGELVSQGISSVMRKKLSKDVAAEGGIPNEKAQDAIRRRLQSRSVEPEFEAMVDNAVGADPSNPVSRVLEQKKAKVDAERPKETFASSEFGPRAIIRMSRGEEKFEASFAFGRGPKPGEPDLAAQGTVIGLRRKLDEGFRIDSIEGHPQSIVAIQRELHSLEGGPPTLPAPETPVVAPSTIVRKQLDEAGKTEALDVVPTGPKKRPPLPVIDPVTTAAVEAAIGAGRVPTPRAGKKNIGVVRNITSSGEARAVEVELNASGLATKTVAAHGNTISVVYGKSESLTSRRAMALATAEEVTDPTELSSQTVGGITPAEKLEVRGAKGEALQLGLFDTPRPPVKSKPVGAIPNTPDVKPKTAVTQLGGPALVQLNTLAAKSKLVVAQSKDTVLIRNADSGAVVKRYQFGKGKLLETPQAVFRTADTFLRNFNVAGRIDLRLMQAAASLEETLQSVLDNAVPLGVLVPEEFVARAGARAIAKEVSNESAEVFEKLLETVQNVDFAKPTEAKATLNRVRKSLVFDEVVEDLMPDVQKDFLERAVGQEKRTPVMLAKDTLDAMETERLRFVEPRPNIEDIPAFDEAVRLGKELPYEGSLEIPRREVMSRLEARRAEIREAVGEEIQFLPKQAKTAFVEGFVIPEARITAKVVGEQNAEIQRLITSGGALKSLRNMTESLSDATKSGADGLRKTKLSNHPMQGDKVEVNFAKLNKTSRDQAIVLTDHAMGETRRFRLDVAGYKHAVGWLKSRVRRIQCAACEKKLRGPIPNPAGTKWVIHDHVSGRSWEFNTLDLAKSWLRKQQPPPDATPSVDLPDDIPLESIADWEFADFRGNVNGPIGPPEFVGNTLGLLGLSEIITPKMVWFQKVEAKTGIRVFSDVYQPLEATKLEAAKFINPRTELVLNLSRGIDSEQAEGMQLLMMAKNAKAEEDLISAYGLSPELVNRTRQFETYYTDLFQTLGLDSKKFFKEQLPLLLLAGHPERVFGKNGPFPKEVAKLLKFINNDELPLRGLDIRDNALRFTRVIGREAFMEPAIRQAREIVDGPDIAGLRSREEPQTLNQYFADVQGLPPAGRKVLRKSVQEILTKIEKTLAAVARKTGNTKAARRLERHMERADVNKLGPSFADVLIGTTYGATMAWRPGVVLRNSFQGLLTLYPRVGERAYFLGLRDALRNDGFIEPRMANAIEDQLSVPFGEDVRLAALGNTLGARLFRFEEQFIEKGLSLYRGVDDFHRATSYHAQKHLIRAAEKEFVAPLATASKVNPLDDASISTISESIGLDMFGEIIEQQGRDLIRVGNMLDLVPLLGRNLAEGTQWIYRRGNGPKWLSSTPGKIFGQFATWPLWYFSYVRQVLSKGSGANRAAAITRLVGVNVGLLEIGRELFGVEAANWLMLGPLSYSGGPHYEAINSLINADFPEGLTGDVRPEAALARNRLYDYWRMFVPGSSAARDAYRAITESNTAEAMRRLFGFPSVKE